jgi:hypothetical protein
MKVWLAFLPLLFVVIALGCISAQQPQDDQPPAPSDGDQGAPPSDSDGQLQPGPEGDRAKLTQCIQDCLTLNKDSSQRSKATWFNDKPGFCTNDCIEAGSVCTVTFFNDQECTVQCDANDLATCA